MISIYLLDITEYTEDGFYFDTILAGSYEDLVEHCDIFGLNLLLDDKDIDEANEERESHYTIQEVLLVKRMEG